MGINTELTYEIQRFEYLIKNGELVADPTSPLKYKLATNGKGIKVETDKRTLSGGGLIIDIDHMNSKYTILTSSHLVSPEDSTDIYYVDEKGAKTDILFSRYLLKFKRISVRSGSVWSAEAEIISDSPKSDLAIIQAETNNRLGKEFENEMGYNINLSWGDWVFLFGYPKGIKQLTGGWVSKSPYPRTRAVDAVVRFGYSGGPVFSLTKDNTQLAFVGVIKSVPRTNLDYIAPGKTLPVGSSLTSEDLSDLSVKREILVNYGTAYFVDGKSIKSFLKSSRNAMNDSGISLAPKFYGN
ncbi:MAG: serine protease [Caldithrix sp.]|nr:MAG: serine protease [Caldithrix sp.]